MAKRTSAQSRQDILDRINEEGLLVAYETALSLCRDVKAPAAARSAASIAIFRAGGMFGTDKPGGDKEPHEMTSAELADSIRELEELAETNQTARAARDLDDDDEDGGIFN